MVEFHTSNAKRAYQRFSMRKLLVGVLLLVASCGGGGDTKTVQTPPATASLSAAPTSVTAGGTSTLTWRSTNATSCAASGGWSGTQATSGTQSTGGLTASTSYSLTCTGSGG